MSGPGSVNVQVGGSLWSGEKFYVLWTNQAGLKVWDGPYESFEKASDSTPMRDRESGAFVTMTG